jgi:predicted CXXCH cytochrome family protein
LSQVLGEELKNTIYISTVTIAFLSIGSSFAHIDSYLLPEECGSCHVGHGLKGEPMLSHAEEEMCYQCHGSESNRALMKASGRLAQQAELADLEKEFNKLYRHPVKQGTGHSSTERLPDLSSSSINHAECVDCHNPHQEIIGGEKKYDVRGLSLSSQYLDKSTEEYEICLKCHGSDIGINSESKNFTRVFALSNKSQHPVTTEVSSDKSVSLLISLDFESSLKCSDCHTNDDRDGPKGPHGSRHKYLLSGNYDTDVYNIENNHAYELCYSCHSRTSILSNESFPLHREHIVGDLTQNRKGTSCYTCHASHSSKDNQHLIAFNPEAVTVDDVSRKVQFDSFDMNSGECYLKCHDHSHSPGKYEK